MNEEMNLWLFKFTNEWIEFMTYYIYEWVDKLRMSSNNRVMIEISKEIVNGSECKHMKKVHQLRIIHENIWNTEIRNSK